MKNYKRQKYNIVTIETKIRHIFKHLMSSFRFLAAFNLNKKNYKGFSVVSLKMAPACYDNKNWHYQSIERTFMCDKLSELFSKLDQITLQT